MPRWRERSRDRSRSRALASETADLVPGLAVTRESPADAETALADTRRALVNLVPPALESHTIEEVIEAELNLVEGPRSSRQLRGARRWDRDAGGSSGRLSDTARRRRQRPPTRARHTYRSDLEIGSDLTLAIEDNGIGFDPAPATTETA